MKNQENKIWMVITSATCCLYLLLTIFSHHIDKYAGGVIYLILTLLIPISFIAMIVCFINGIFQIFRSRKSLTIQVFMPLMICTITLMYTLFSPYQLDSENLESKVVFRACYEGTQNQATLKFREDKTFELHSTGVFFSNNWFYGTYEQKSDSIFLHYSTEKPKRFGDSIVIKNDLLITINQQKPDTSQYFSFLTFYLGYCRGLN